MTLRPTLLTVISASKVSTGRARQQGAREADRDLQRRRLLWHGNASPTTELPPLPADSGVGLFWVPPGRANSVTRINVVVQALRRTRGDCGLKRPGRADQATGDGSLDRAMTMTHAWGPHHLVIDRSS